MYCIGHANRQGKARGKQLGQAFIVERWWGQAASKITLAAGKGRAPVDVEIDGVVYKEAMVVAVMMSEKESELLLYPI